MLKKLMIYILIICTSISLASCKKNKDDSSVDLDKWNGTYKWLDEQTGEFKYLEATGTEEESIAFKFSSVRTSEEFTAPLKSDSGRYAVVNLGSKTVKITLSANKNVVAVDDMWTDSKEKRLENWTGEYKILEEGEEKTAFGDTLWNGEYFCEECDLTVSVYGIQEGFALLGYDIKNGDTTETLTFRCLEPEPRKAVFTEGERLIILELIDKGRKIKITDLYMNDTENTGISGIYVKK